MSVRPPGTVERKSSFQGLQRVISRTSEHIEAALQDVGEFYDQEQVQARLQQILEEPAKTTLPPSKTEKSLEELDHNDNAHELGTTMLDPRKVVLRDKLCFFIGVVNLCLVAFWVGRWPSSYHHYWLFKSVVLFSLRYITYRSKGWHWLMLELCYAANICGFVHLYKYPSSAFWRKLSFALMAGPLQWSIVAMRNSLVFHDFEKITTLMMHASPAITAWTMRWSPDPKWTAVMSAEELKEYNTATWSDMVLMPMMFYLAWVTMYYLVTFVLFKKRLERKGRMNMMALMVHEPAKKKKPRGAAALVLRMPPLLQPIVYLSCHGLGALLSLLPTKIWWDSMWAHTGVLAFCIGIGIWNGASFYFKVFAKRYLAELEAQGGAKKKE